MFHMYKGIKINKTFRHGYHYYRIEGRERLYGTLKEAKAAVDAAYDYVKELIEDQRGKGLDNGWILCNIHALFAFGKITELGYRLAYLELKGDQR